MSSKKRLFDVFCEIFFTWSPTGGQLAFFAQQHGKAVLQVWDIRSGRQIFSSQPLNSNPGNPSWSPDGRIIAAGIYTDANNGSKSIIQFWNAQNGQELVSYDAPRRPAFFNWSPDSRFLAALNMQTYTYGWMHCTYGSSDGDGVGSQNLPLALQVFQAPTSKKE